MKVILTGITGNIGYEVARVLLGSGYSVVPIVRVTPGHSIADKLKKLDADFGRIEEYISADLLTEVPEYALTDAECIIHCAGVVHFRKAGRSNELMMKNLVDFVAKGQTPIYYISTAYLLKPEGQPLWNSYEADKLKAENILNSSSIPKTILRPSIVTGNSMTGRILHFSGYYVMAQALKEAFQKADKIRFPDIKNDINIVPVDWVARAMVDCIKEKKEGTFYAVNSRPPDFGTLLRETLKFYKLDHKLELVDCTADEYKNLNLSEAEKNLFEFCAPFFPYLVNRYNFPDSLCQQSFGPGYVEKILTYFKESENAKMEE